MLTAVYDRYDTLKELLPQTVDVEAICVTDDLSLTSSTWTIVYEPRIGVHPNRAAKAPKCCPWRYTDARTSIWIDASFLVISPTFVSDMGAIDAPLAQFAHWDRSCLYDEAAFSAGIQKYGTEPLGQQVARYESWGHPRDWGLWATGLIAMRHTTPVVRAGEAWLHEIDEFSFQDQVSQPAVLRREGLRPVNIPGTYAHNPWLCWQGSARH